ncbi:MAG TPA: PDZ domain-containing protein, partial [Woeseiaceae bacterium]|nr:PDZ domain-containing protein [Woeseiaceae bacterium]
RGISAELISDFIDQIKNNRPLYSLEIQLNYIPLFAARKLGLNDDWVSKYESLNKTERRLLIVKNSIAGSPASRIIKNGDILLSIDGKLISSFRDYEKASQKKNVQIKLWRENQFKEVTVSTVALNGEGIDDVFFWAGAHLHKPHRALNQRGIEAEGVYVAFNNYGSPATRYGLNAGQRIVAVDDVATPDLISFKKEVIGRKDRSSLRLRTISWNGEPNMVTLKLDNKYWPPFEIKKSNKEWKRNPVN